MATLSDILTRTAANIGMDVDSLRTYASALCSIVAEAHARGESVDLMTFGTLEPPDAKTRFRAHATLLPTGDGDSREQA